LPLVYYEDKEKYDHIQHQMRQHPIKTCKTFNIFSAAQLGFHYS